MQPRLNFLKMFIWCPTCPKKNIYLFKINNRNTRKKCKICSKLTTETQEPCD